MNKQPSFFITALLGLVTLSFSSCIKEYKNPADGTPGELTTIFALRQAYKGTEFTLDGNALGGASKIQGVVISDKAGLNIDASSFVLQLTVASANQATDVTRGIVIKMDGTPAYAIGDSLRISIAGAKLNRINGKLTISGITADKVSLLASGKTPFMRSVTQGMLHDVMDQYESTLVSINADVLDYAAGATLGGVKQLNDNTGAPVYLHTLPGAAFSPTALPVDAQFTGIAGFYNEGGSDTTGARKTIMPRNASDIQFMSGALYAGFPESFESPDASVKASYNSGTNIVALKTGSWLLLQAILGNTPVSDKYNSPGKQSIRFQQNLTTSGFVQMNFDVPDGASKVTVFYGKYGTDAKGSIRLESSVNGGTTWTAVGTTLIDMPDKGNKQAVWVVNISGPVRFRINKLGTGTTNNGRLSIDDFAIYKK
jgi:hypothetical protein